MKKDNLGFRFSELIPFLKSKSFGHTMLRFGIVVLLLWVLHSIFLRLYTNHGQKLKMPKYIGVYLDKATEHAHSKGYEVQVLDSIFINGKPGGIVLSQIPGEGSMVKKGRTIYVSVSKFHAEQFLSSELPILYGKNFRFKRDELHNLFDLNTRIIEGKYDPGPEGHILEVYYHGQRISDNELRKEDVLINRGDTLDFIISMSSGGKIDVPDLLCKTMAEVEFLLSSYKLELGAVEQLESVDDVPSSYVAEQSPKPGESVLFNTKVDVKISQTKPAQCN